MKSHPAIHELTGAVRASSQDHAVLYIAIVDEDSERRYYDELIKHIRNASEAIYRLGGGFYHEHRSTLFSALIRAEENALQRGVGITRIQTGAAVALSWAEGYARLLEQFPDSFVMLADLEDALLNGVALIDPRGHNPVVHLLFETTESAPLGSTGRPVIALFIINAKNLASALAEQLTRRAERLPRMTPQDARDLAHTFTYFGWGVHMASRKMLRDVPDARLLGTAILRNWRRDIGGLLAGPANRATINHTGDADDFFDGVAYELSWWGKKRLDRLERRAYEEVSVVIELNAATRPAFTYVPLPPAAASEQVTPGSWIDLVVEGALENNMTRLLADLRSSGVSVEAFRKGTL